MQQSTNSTAVASLVLGIIALFQLLSAGCWWVLCLPLPLVFGILAWILGKNAISQIDAGIGNPSDRGMATAGYVMGVISVVLSVLGMCCWGGVLSGTLSMSTLPWWSSF